MATAVATVHQWTYADLENLPDDDNIYDIVGGQVVVRNVPPMDHGDALTDLLILLLHAQDAGFGRMYTTTAAVALDFAQRGMAAIDVPHPDIFFVREDRLSLRGQRGFEGVPDLIVEVLSRSTRREHRAGGRLWQAYERNGGPHYWLVDLRNRTIRQYTLIGTPYQQGRYGEPVTLREGDALTSVLFPNVSIPVAQVFRYV
ncbi:MAG: Uma2 family endonuclease [Chloroflexota bacterium]